MKGSWLNIYPAAAKDSKEALLIALRDVAEAQRGVGRVAARAQVNREHLYRALSKDGNPRLGTFMAIADALDLEFLLKPKNAVSKAGPSPIRSLRTVRKRRKLRR